MGNGEEVPTSAHDWRVDMLITGTGECIRALAK